MIRRIAARRRGFTLIEMLIVISLLGLLLSIAAGNHRRALEKARDAALMVDLQALRNAVYRYAGDHQGGFPPTLAGLQGTYLNRVPAAWRGAVGQGSFGYDPVRGTVILCETDGLATATSRDARGVCYGDY